MRSGSNSSPSFEKVTFMRFLRFVRTDYLVFYNFIFLVALLFFIYKADVSVEKFRRECRFSVVAGLPILTVYGNCTMLMSPGANVAYDISFDWRSSSGLLLLFLTSGDI